MLSAFLLALRVIRPTDASLAENFGYNMNNTTPCNIEYCNKVYPIQTPANLSVSGLSILNPVLTYPYNNQPETYTSFDTYYFPNGYFSSLKDEITTYYNTVWVWQAGIFAYSNTVTQAEHLKKQTFITGFFDWLYNLHYSNNPLYNYLRDNPSATSKLFQFFADINLNGSEFVYINNIYANYNEDNSAKFINWLAQKVSEDYIVLEKYVNNQISKEQFSDYYKRIFDFESGLSYSQALFLKENPSYQKPLYNYLSKNYSSESVQIGKEHIELLMSNPDYEQFVNNHGSTGDPEIVWWEDDTWLDNPNNFNLDIDRAYDQYDQFADLNVQEKALVAAFPVQAYTIKENIQTAFDITDSRMGANGGLNDKKDAFRHAFFQAINTRDVPPRLTPTFVSAPAIVTLFSNAHESEVPAPLLLEKQMDLYNNAVGISYCWNCWTTSDNNIADAIMLKLNKGELIYINPLDRVSSRIFDANRDGLQDCPTCLNGIIPISKLTPTNQ